MDRGTMARLRIIILTVFIRVFSCAIVLFTSKSLELNDQLDNTKKL
jgi:hypothetical protein